MNPIIDAHERFMLALADALDPKTQLQSQLKDTSRCGRAASPWPPWLHVLWPCPHIYQPEYIPPLGPIRYICAVH